MAPPEHDIHMFDMSITGLSNFNALLLCPFILYASIQYHHRALDVEKCFSHHAIIIYYETLS